MTLLRLTRGKMALIDDADANLVLPYRWKYGKRGYAIGTLPYWKGRINGIRRPQRTIPLHHLILKDCPIGFLRDHKNRIPLDNRRSNLRLLTHQQSVSNTGPRRGRKYKGIELRKSGNYIACLTYKGKRIRRGMYKTAEEAALAFNELALRYQGEYAYLNKVNE